MELRYDGFKIDSASQRIILGLQGGETHIASELARVAGLDDAQQVRYRIEEYLAPAGLVDVVGTRQVSGGSAKMYGLTEAGEQALAARPDDFGEEPTVDENAERIKELESAVEILRADLSKESSRIGNRATRNSVNRTQDAVDDKLDEMSKMLSACDRHVENGSKQIQTMQKIKSEVESLVSDFEPSDELKREVEQVSEQTDSLSDQTDTIESDISNLEERVSESEADMEELDEDLNKLQERGFWGRIRWLVSGRL